MKQFFLSLLAIVVFCQIASAQKIRLNLYSAYAFPDKFDSYYDQYNYYNGQINGGFQWGGGIEFMTNPAYGVEILYYREDTQAPTTYFENTVKFTNLDVGINYIMIGGNRYFRKPGGRVEGFGGLMAGMAVVSIKNPDDNRSSTPSKFAWGIRGGANIYLTETVAIKLQIQLLSVVQGFGGGFYVGTGGAGAGVTTYSTFYQFGLGGGLTFALGK